MHILLLLSICGSNSAVTEIICFLAKTPICIFKCKNLIHWIKNIYTHFPTFLSSGLLWPCLISAQQHLHSPALPWQQVPNSEAERADGARAKSKILGPIALSMQKQMHRSLHGTDALTGQRGEKEREGMKWKRKHEDKGGSQIDATHFIPYCLSLCEHLVLVNFHVGAVTGVRTQTLF